MVLSLLGDNTLYTVLPDPTIWSRAGLTLGWVGVLLGVNRIVRLIFHTWAGVVFDRLPRRAASGDEALAAVVALAKQMAAAMQEDEAEERSPEE